MVHARFLIPHFASLCKKISLTNLNIFNRVPNPNICFWDTLIRAHCEKSEINKCFLVFKRMTRDKYTFPFSIEACSNALALRERRITDGLSLSMMYGVEEGDMFAVSSWIDLCSKGEDIKSARKVFDGLRCVITESLNFGDLLKAKFLFDEMPVKSLASWNAMIKGLVRFGELKSARILFDEMPERNKVSFMTMIYGYAKVGDMVAARLLFDELPEKDLFSWYVLISGYLQNGEPCEVVKVFPEMWAMHVEPDEFMMESLMVSCWQLGLLELAKLVASCMSGRVDVSVALLDANATCGYMDILFEKIPKRHYFPCCSVILSAYFVHCVLAVAMFETMINKGLRPDDVTFHVILKACTYVGLVKDGRRYFDLMINEYSLSPSHYHYECMVNLLVKSRKLKDAYELIKSIPVEPHFRSWGALLGACELYCETDFAKEIGWQLVELIKSIPVEPHFRSLDTLLGARELCFDTDFAEEIRWQLIEIQSRGGDPFILFNIYREASHWFYGALADEEYGKQLMSG